MPVKTVRRYHLLNHQRKHRVDSRDVRRFLAGLVEELGRPEASFCVVFVNDKAMHAYNLRFRHIDKTTDVLSFSGEEDYLGDILISTETAWRQARKSPTLSFNNNIRRLVLHGVLHLTGYDHETDNGEMRAIERRLRRKFEC
jgi:probable rRNA maturation factor